METYEAADYRNVYARTMELAGYNHLLAEHPTFALPNLEVLDRSAGSGSFTPGLIPPVVLKAVAWLESGWAQASYDPFVNHGEVGPTLISHDCGYGIMQVTTGMQNIAGFPNLDQAMIGGHFGFNIARGARILADKWNQAPEFRPLVGNRDPTIIENWYYALWSYNGFAFKNHPLNPAYDPNRPPYSCGPEGDGFGHNAAAYPYQELVMGCIAHPPVRQGALLWDPIEVTLPNRNDPVFAGPLALANWEPCALSLACAPMDMPIPNPWHRDPTTSIGWREPVMGAPAMQVSHGSLSVIAPPGGQSLEVAVNIANVGTGVLAWRATSSASWLKIDRYQGVSLGSDLGSISKTLLVRGNGTTLSPGTYSAQVTIETLYGTGGPIRIPVTFFVSLQAGTMLLGDFTGDGKSDAALPCCADYASLWLSNQGNDFSFATYRPSPGYGVALGTWQTGDFNGDGRTDLAHLCCDSAMNVWLSRGDGRFDVRAFTPWPGYWIQGGSWRTGDFNGDGKTDLIHLAPGDYVRTWLSNGDGSFSVGFFSAGSGYWIQGGSWQTGDFNGDGRTDLLHLLPTDYVRPWFSNGDGSFNVGIFSAGPGYWVQGGSWQVGDFNGDAKTDLVHLLPADYVRPWLSRGDGSFDVTFFSPGSGYWVQGGSWQVGDFNGDHRTDLVHLLPSDHVRPWLSRGDGSFNVGYFSPWPGYGISTGFWHTADFNGDGMTDLLHRCCHYANKWVSAGNGSFAVNSFTH
jgi:hypothetical protein